jgi:hypothetical protein
MYSTEEGIKARDRFYHIHRRTFENYDRADQRRDDRIRDYEEEIRNSEEEFSTEFGITHRVGDELPYTEDWDPDFDPRKSFLLLNEDLGKADND